MSTAARAWFFGAHSGLHSAAADLGDRRSLYKRAKHLIGLPLFDRSGGFDGMRGAFFLGSGISVPAGLPSWKELIIQLAESSSAYRNRGKDLGEIAAPDAALLLYRDDDYNFRGPWPRR